MWRLWLLVKWLWTFLLASFTLGVVVNYATGGEFRKEILDFASRNPALISIFPLTLFLLTLWSYVSHRTRVRFLHEQALKQQFALFKPVTDLLPIDLNFQAVALGQKPDFHLREYHPAYIPRRLVPEEQISSPNPINVYTESDIASFLKSGKSIALVGDPYFGKSRTIYEVLRTMTDFFVVSPLWDRKVPDDQDFALLQDRKVVLLVENIQEHLDPVIDLARFCDCLRDAIKAQGGKFGLLATCRGGADLQAIAQARQGGVREVFSEVNYQLGLVPLTTPEKTELAHLIGKDDWDETKADDYPSPGSITMADYVSAMRNRYNSLNTDRKMILWAVKLLDYGGVRPISHSRLRSVLERVLKTEVVDLDRELAFLRDEAFLQKSEVLDPVLPEPAYLYNSVRYRPGTTLDSDLFRLTIALSSTKDVEGLWYLGLTCIRRDCYQDALEAYNQVIRLKPDDAEAWHNKGVAIAHLEQYEEAIQAYDVAIRLKPDEAMAWYNKGVALDYLKRYEEAIQAYEEAIRLKPDYAMAWHNKGVALEKSLKPYDALQAYEEAIRLKPDDAEAWYNKGLSLYHLDRFPEALIAFEEALRFVPDEPDFLKMKGATLNRMG